MRKRLKLGMVGGGQGAFFGGVHRMAARLTDRYDFVAGALSADPARSVASGEELGLAGERCYADFRVMARREAERADPIDVVAIVTPNHLHAAAACAFLNAGVHVMCDKPMTATLDEARQVEAAALRSGRIFGVTYTNSGFGMVREARAIVARGDLGSLRVIRVRFPQEWLATATETSGNKQAEWRTDPARSGAGSLGDIGTHAFHLAEFVSGQTCTALSAQVSTFVSGRRVDDDATLLLRFSGGATGSIWISQVAIGETNGLSIELYGDKASLAWSVEHANVLRFCPLGEQTRCLDRASHGTSVKGRLPSGHAEGFVEALSQLYLDLADQIEARAGGGSAPAASLLMPTVEDGVRGMRFIDAALVSSAADGKWVGL